MYIHVHRCTQFHPPSIRPSFAACAVGEKKSDLPISDWRGHPQPSPSLLYGGGNSSAGNGMDKMCPAHSDRFLPAFAHERVSLRFLYSSHTISIAPWRKRVVVPMRNRACKHSETSSSSNVDPGKAKMHTHNTIMEIRHCVAHSRSLSLAARALSNKIARC